VTLGDVHNTLQLPVVRDCRCAMLAMIAVSGACTYHVPRENLAGWSVKRERVRQAGNDVVARWRIHEARLDNVGGDVGDGVFDNPRNSCRQ